MVSVIAESISMLNFFEIGAVVKPWNHDRQTDGQAYFCINNINMDVLYDVGKEHNA